MNYSELEYRWHMPSTDLEYLLNNEVNFILERAQIDHVSYMKDGRIIDKLDYYFSETKVEGICCSKDN